MKLGRILKGLKGIAEWALKELAKKQRNAK